MPPTKKVYNLHYFRLKNIFPIEPAVFLAPFYRPPPPMDHQVPKSQALEMSNLTEKLFLNQIIISPIIGAEGSVQKSFESFFSSEKSLKWTKVGNFGNSDQIPTKI